MLLAMKKMIQILRNEENFYSSSDEVENLTEMKVK